MRTATRSVLLPILVFVSLIGCTQHSEELLQSGPMLGYSQMREVMIWIQTKSSAAVRIQYWEKGNEETKYFTDEKVTNKNEAFTAKLIADKLEPGKQYNYKVYINNLPIDLGYPLEFQTQTLWQWRTDPPEIKFAIASCFYVNEEVYDRPGEPYGGNFEILDVLYDKHPEFMVWMGDNVYLREADWYSRSGILKRYTHTRSYPALQKLLASTHHYATWDDHDFGINNSDRSMWNKETTLEAFKLFWANPSFGVYGNPGVTTYFQWGDLDFFLMDDRYYRSPEHRTETTDREVLGEAQVEWLIDNLTTSYAPFKFVVIGTPFLNPNAGGENHATYPEERKKILDMIAVENIRGVIFLTGDVHRSELTKLERKNNYPLYEFTISPLTAGPSRVYPNDARVEGTVVTDRSFGLFNVSGPRKDRTLTCQVFDWQGNERWSVSINENELRK